MIHHFIFVFAVKYKSLIDIFDKLHFVSNVISYRLLLHGRITMSVQKMTWLYHATLDPYNTTEFMDWTYSNLILDWTNGVWNMSYWLKKDVFCTSSNLDILNLIYYHEFLECSGLFQGSLFSNATLTSLLEQRQNMMIVDLYTYPTWDSGMLDQ